MAILAAATFRSHLGLIWEAWSLYEEWSHGFLVPFVAGYVLFVRREEWKGLPLQWSIWGLCLLFLSLLWHFYLITSTPSGRMPPLALAGLNVCFFLGA
jgi:hypothetical protein